MRLPICPPSGRSEHGPRHCPDYLRPPKRRLGLMTCRSAAKPPNLISAIPFVAATIARGSRSHLIEQKRARVDYAARPRTAAWPLARDVPSQWTLPAFAVASIGALLLDRRPPAVTRSIIAFIIDPSYQVLRRWPATHIGKEGCEASAPAHANFDAASAIMLEPNIARAVAPLHYLLPSSIFRRVRTRIAVGSVRCFGDHATATS